MTKKTENIKTKLADFPEEITEDGLKIYGETSYENQMAVLSHFLHNHPKRLNKEQKEEIILAVREFLSRKEFRQGFDKDELSDEEILKAAESPLQYNLFSDFFDVPFLHPRSLSLHSSTCLQASEVSASLCKNKTVNVFFPLNGTYMLRKHIL